MVIQKQDDNSMITINSNTANLQVALRNPEQEQLALKLETLGTENEGLQR